MFDDSEAKMMDDILRTVFQGQGTDMMKIKNKEIRP